ncbi:MAG: molybdenum cofactor biosysynthesis protein, partial [Opitutaceae bacterium]|nr:molybdenum cofactor biosysynthesis protein [Opitutaceae bacterium]
MRLSGLFLYPVKSLGGCAVSSAQIDAHGLVGDRRFLVIDETGRFLTQRTLPRM